MTTFYVDNIKHTSHTNKSTGFPKLVVNGSYFLAFPDKGYKGKYEFSEWMYFEGPIVLTKDNTRYRVAASSLGDLALLDLTLTFHMETQFHQLIIDRQLVRITRVHRFIAITV